MICASEFGFFPGNDAKKNSEALQKALDIGGDIFIDGKGIADIVDPMMIGDDTSITFEEGLSLRRNESGE